MAVRGEAAQRPEGQLLAAALKRDGRSANKAAPAAGMSPTRWRHIVNGYQPAGNGARIPVVGPALTIAKMAKVVGVTPEELDRVGRQDAAAELRSLTASEAAWAEDRSDGLRRADLLEKITVLSQELAAAVQDFARLEDEGVVDIRRVQANRRPIAAYREDTPSAREQFDVAQDEAAEAPDAPGPEHGA